MCFLKIHIFMPKSVKVFNILTLVVCSLLRPLGSVWIKLSQDITEVLKALQK